MEGVRQVKAEDFRIVEGEYLRRLTQARSDQTQWSRVCNEMIKCYLEKKRLRDMVVIMPTATKDNLLAVGGLINELSQLMESMGLRDVAQSIVQQLDDRLALIAQQDQPVAKGEVETRDPEELAIRHRRKRPTLYIGVWDEVDKVTAQLREATVGGVEEMVSREDLAQWIKVEDRVILDDLYAKMKESETLRKLIMLITQGGRRPLTLKLNSESTRWMTGKWIIEIEKGTKDLLGSVVFELCNGLHNSAWVEISGAMKAEPNGETFAHMCESLEQSSIILNDQIAREVSYHGIGSRNVSKAARLESRHTSRYFDLWKKWHKQAPVSVATRLRGESGAAARAMLARASAATPDSQYAPIQVIVATEQRVETISAAQRQYAAVQVLPTPQHAMAIHGALLLRGGGGKKNRGHDDDGSPDGDSLAVPSGDRSSLSVTPDKGSDIWASRHPELVQSEQKLSTPPQPRQLSKGEEITLIIIDHYIESDDKEKAKQIIMQAVDGFGDDEKKKTRFFKELQGNTLGLVTKKQGIDSTDPELPPRNVSITTEELGQLIGISTQMLKEDQALSPATPPTKTNTVAKEQEVPEPEASRPGWKP